MSSMVSQAKENSQSNAQNIQSYLVLQQAWTSLEMMQEEQHCQDL